MLYFYGLRSNVWCRLETGIEVTKVGIQISRNYEKYDKIGEKSMARGVNKAIIIGHLGADPEQRRTQSGALVVNCNVATTDYWNDQETRERQERTEWHRVVFFGRTAEVASQYLRKGSMVYIEGRLQTRKWQDPRTGMDRYTTEIIGREMTMLDSRGEGRSDNYGGSRGSDREQPQSSYSQESSTQSGSPSGASGMSEDPIDDMPW